MSVLLRTLLSPIFLFLILIVYFLHAIRGWFLFLIYGGEFITYDKYDRIAIKDIYNKLNENRDERN